MYYLVNLQYKDYTSMVYCVSSVWCELVNSSVCFNQHQDYIKISSHTELSILEGLITYQTITMCSSQHIIETIPHQLSSLEFHIRGKEEGNIGIKNNFLRPFFSHPILLTKHKPGQSEISGDIFFYS